MRQSSQWSKYKGPAQWHNTKNLWRIITSISTLSTIKVNRNFMWFLWIPEAHLTLFFCIQYLVRELCRELCSCIHTLFGPLPLVLRDLFVDVSVSFTVLLQLSHLLQKALNLLLLMLQCPFQLLCHSTVQSLWDISLYSCKLKRWISSKKLPYLDLSLQTVIFSFFLEQLVLQATASGFKNLGQLSCGPQMLLWRQSQNTFLKHFLF